MADESVLSVREAAERLGISAQRVRQLVTSGALPARRSSSGWLVPASAVVDRSLVAYRGRPVSPRTAWAVVRLLAGDAIADRRLRHQARRLVEALPDPVDDLLAWRRLLGPRGRRQPMWGHPGVLDRLRSDARVSLGGIEAVAVGGDGLSPGGQLDLYVRADDVDALVSEFALRQDEAGAVVLHVVPGSVPDGLAPEAAQPVPVPAGAADLLEDADPRSHAAGARVLRQLRRELA